MMAGKVAVTAAGFRSDRSGGQMVWKYLIDDWKASGVRVVCEDEHPTPVSLANRPLAHAFWYLSTYGHLRNTLFVVDQGDGMRLALLLRKVRRERSNRLVVVVHHLREAFRYGHSVYVRLAVWNETAVLRMAHRVVVHTEDTARDVTLRGVPATRITVIPLGTREPGAPIPVRRLGADQPLKLLWVGGDFRRKGLFELLQAVERTAPPRPHVTVAGQPLEGVEEARAEASRLGVESCFTFLGFVPPADLERLWYEHEAFVLPSLHEGHGLALDEALVRGVPALVSDLSVFLERIGREEALFVPRGDVAALANGLAALRDDGLRERLSASGRARADRLPRWESTRRAYMRVVRDEMAELDADA